MVGGGHSAAHMRSPGARLALGVAVALAMLCTVLVLASRPSWLGLSLVWDPTHKAAVVQSAEGPAHGIARATKIVALRAQGKRVDLAAEDFVREPDSSLPTFSAYARFLRRQGELAELQSAEIIELVTAEGKVLTLKPRPGRPLTSLPAAYWVQLVVGLFAWLIAAGVWAFRPQEASTRYLLLSGAATMVFAPLAGVYSTRELALSYPMFLWLSELNHCFGLVYAAAMIALLWYYPRRVSAFPFGPLVVVAYALWFAGQVAGVFESMLVARRWPVFLALLLTFALSAVQWRKTQADPVGRAAFSWFLMSWLVGTTAFVCLTMVPQLFGVDTGALQGYAFSLFLLVYGGLAFGILRFRLFELGEWWFRIFSWVFGGALFLALDLVLFAGLSLPQSLSLGVALIVCGFVYLPLRSWLWTRLIGTRANERPDLFKSVVRVAFAASLGEREERWITLCKRLFDPLYVERSEEREASVRLEGDGLFLRVPSAAGGSVRLGYKNGGRNLFAPRDRDLIAQAVDMLRYVDESRDAYNQGVREERTRIARDLHDDIGSRLLSGLHQAHVEDTKEVISQAIAEMRTIIHGLSDERLTLDHIIAELRHETSLRLEAAGLELEWPLADEPEELVVSYAVYKNYLSIMRELVANIVRHARARRVSVRVELHGERLVSEVRDDGIGFTGVHAGKGQGLTNLHKRVRELKGTLTYEKRDEGTCVRIDIPLRAQVALPSFAPEAVP